MDNAGALPTALPPLAYLSPTNSTGPTILISTTRRSRDRGCSEACTHPKRAALWCQFKRRSQLRAEFSKLTGSGSFRYWIRLTPTAIFLSSPVRNESKQSYNSMTKKWSTMRADPPRTERLRFDTIAPSYTGAWYKGRQNSHSVHAVWQRVADVRVHSYGFVSTGTVGCSIIGSFVSHCHPQTNAFIPADYFNGCTTSMILSPI